MDNQTTTAAETLPAAPEYMGSATYSPEDNKLRLYVGRVPRADFERLRSMGWTSTPKQSCDFVAHWTPERRDLCIEWCGSIEDEDQSPAERAADRAERFGDYRDKRTDEATGQADRYDAGPSAHGFQNYARAVRAADRHDRIAGRACDAWGKAEYWQRRTAGVISHALHVSTPAVRMGRIKELEAEIRKCEKTRDEYENKRQLWQTIAAQTDAEKQNRGALALAGAMSSWVDYQHPRQATIKESLWSLLTSDRTNGDPITGGEAAAFYLAEHPEIVGEGDWLTHYRLRLAYETQMIEAQGGRAAFVEMVAGGFIGKHQIQKVNKSTATGRTVSVNVFAPTRANYDRKGKPYDENNPRPLTIHTINVERMASDAYRAPTAEELEVFHAARKAAKAAAPKKPPCPLVNPTDADAERLIAMWNEKRRANHEEHNQYRSPEARKMHSDQFKPCKIQRITQAIYSANSKGSFARAQTRALCSLGRLEERNVFHDYSGQAQRKAERGPAVCEIRTTGFDPVHVLILTDKPQKPLPAAVWQPYALAPVAPAFALEACE